MILLHQLADGRDLGAQTKIEHQVVAEREDSVLAASE